MRRRDFIKVIGGAVIAWPLAARAQQPERIRRLGVLMGYPEGDKQAQAGANALRTGLQNLGWIEGRNIQIDYRWPGPDAEKARTFAKELIGMKSGRNCFQYQSGDSNPATRNSHHSNCVRIRR